MNDQNPPSEYSEAEVIEPDGISREQALIKVRTPALCLIVLWGVTMVNYLLEILLSVTGLRNQLLISLSESVPPEMQAQLEQLTNPNPTLIFSLSFVFLLVGILALVGSVKMLKLQSFALALTAAIISVIPCFGSCCCCSMLLIPFGIWALVILSDAKVRQHFR
jgi:hypothetical protein